MTSSRTPRLQGFKLLFAFFCLVCSGLSALAAPVKFDIPAQSAAAALKLFNKQSDKPAIFMYDDLKAITANEVVGEMEPLEALQKLLKGTGLEVTQTTDKNFVIGKSAKSHAATGSIRGSLSKGPARGDDVRVMIHETGQQIVTDENGDFNFSSVAPGTYLIVATADGFQPLHITDVVVKAGYDLSLSKEELRPANGTVELQPYVVRAESVFELEKVEISEAKPQPFSDRNVDLPRGINDVQPYTIFDSKTIEQSGALNVNDFLKQRLTMNTTAVSGNQLPPPALGSGVNTGAVNLRGLGLNETLILVDGRRMANVAAQVSTSLLGASGDQPDINGIPVESIDRIEVLPSSASAIYGGSAVGGVINIILKKNYVGGEVRASYDITADGHAPIRSLSLSFGQALEGGKTHISISAKYSDSKPLYIGDRDALLERGYNTFIKTNPGYVSGNYNSLGMYGFPPGYGFTPVQGNSTNISSFAYDFDSSGNLFFHELTLKSTGASLNSLVANIPRGVNGTTNPGAIIGGKWDFTLPDTNQTPNGLKAPLGSFPKDKSIAASVRRQMTENIELFVDVNHNENLSYSNINWFSGVSRVEGSNPINPFNETVSVVFPYNSTSAFNSKSVTNSGTIGAILKLPFRWTGEIDYTWSQNKFSSLVIFPGGGIRDGNDAFNPFQDNVANPPSAAALVPYNQVITYDGSNTMNDLALRGAGPLVRLPWGEVTLAGSLEHRKEGSPDSINKSDYPDSTIAAANPYDRTITTYFGQSQNDDSASGELNIPLVKKNVVPFLYSLEAQVAGRMDKYTVNAGTTGSTYHPYTTPSTLDYNGPTLNGERYSFKTSYKSSNGTVGLKYNPVSSLSFRASRATAFLPPTYSQLLPDPLPSPYPSTITDPKNPNAGAYDVVAQYGGNPNLKPQSSKSTNAGMIWQPTVGALKGLRVNLEYYAIQQHDVISGLSPQTIVNQEAQFPGRVTRDPGTGLVTRVDASLVNLYAYKTNGWDLTVNYEKETSIGTFDFLAAGSVTEHQLRQYAQDTPSLEYVDFVNSGGQAKSKANGTLTWSNRHWTVAWTTTFYPSYAQSSAMGDPENSYNNNGILTAQGSDRVDSQVYHDLFVGYAFGHVSSSSKHQWVRAGTKLLANTTIQVGVKNVFNTLPAFDANYGYAPFYYSPFGDIRLRDFWMTVRKSF